MGTNYYADIEGDNIHLGKYSSGHRFLFKAHASMDIFNYGSMLNTISPPGWMSNRREARIIDEYGKGITIQEFTGMVESSQRGAKPAHDYEDAQGRCFAFEEFF